MRHCLIYHGGFERNFPNLKAGATTFQGTDGAEHPLAASPDRGRRRARQLHGESRKEIRRRARPAGQERRRP